MEGPGRSTFVSHELTPRPWEYDRVSTTLDICASNLYMSSYTNGISPLYATKDIDYEENGLWDCKNSNETILEIPYGRAAGALMVKSGGETEACLQTIGGLSMGQLRWLTSSQTKSSLTANGEMPGLMWPSVVPNDNGNNIPEWIDLHSSCPDTEIVLSHRWSNKTDITILEETVLCANCVQTDSLYTSTAQRLSLIHI